MRKFEMFPYEYWLFVSKEGEKALSVFKDDSIIFINGYIYSTFVVQYNTVCPKLLPYRWIIFIPKQLKGAYKVNLPDQRKYEV